MVALAGMDPVRFLNCEDRHEVLVTQRIAAEVVRVQDVRLSNLATDIANKVLKGLGGN